eukprot:1048477-Prymnesium_polylepis.2
MNASAFVSRVRPNETLVTGGVHRGCAASVDVTNTSSLSVRTVLRRVVSILNVAGAEVTLSTSRVDHAARARLVPHQPLPGRSLHHRDASKGR